MKKLFNFNLPIIDLDKANHFVYGFIIFITLTILLNIFTINLDFNNKILKINIIGVIITTLFALSKELKDQLIYKGFCWKDLLATILPSILITILNIINGFK